MLEQRIAELEAATLRKGNEKVTLQIYGQVNRALLYWDDGFQSGSHVIDNSTSSSRFGFIGESHPASGVTVGYRIEFEFGPSLSEDYGPSGGDWADQGARLRHSYLYVDDKTLGRVSLGHQSPATDDITIINLGSQMNDAAVHYNNAFPVPLAIGGELVTDLKWGQIAHSVDSLRGNFVRYDTPNLQGFVLSSAWSEDDIWDVALRYAHDWSTFRFAAGIGYMDDREHSYRDVRGSASLLHVPTGLYVSAAAGLRDDDVSILSASGPAHFHYVQLGLKRRWLPWGDTTFYADYGYYQNFNVGNLLSVNPQTNTTVIWGTLAHTEVVREGFGIEQAFDDAGPTDA